MWARANGCDWSLATSACAAKNGHLKILKWIRDPTLVPEGKICPWDEMTCAWTARNGQLEILKWIRDPTMVPGGDICLWDALTCAWAAEYGQLEVLKWARSNGCPWDLKTEKLAKKKWPDIFF
jgi:hypothetical protein